MDPQQKSTYLKLASATAERAGRLLATAYASDAGILSSSGKDVKTQADLEAEAAIMDALRPTGISLLGEETGLHQQDLGDGLRWIIDPLDGTFNFTRGLPACCVSIGLWEGLDPILGVIHDFTAGCSYSGIVDEGAWRDDQPMSVSEFTDPAQCALATGFPNSRDFSAEALAPFIRRVQGFKKIRLIGSAALSLAYVATGHLDAYFEEGIYFWDVAAGLALVKAAGGQIHFSPPNSNWKMDARATNGRIPRDF